jgi:hypothetical protein
MHFIVLQRVKFIALLVHILCSLLWNLLHFGECSSKQLPLMGNG